MNQLTYLLTGKPHPLPVFHNGIGEKTYQPPVERTCSWCGKSFLQHPPIKTVGMYCSGVCRNAGGRMGL